MAEQAAPDLTAVFAANLIRLRKAAGWTQTDLADEAGVSVATVSNIERGKGGTSLVVADALAVALETTVDQMTGRLTVPVREVSGA